jgi:hypothetical protein
MPHRAVVLIILAVAALSLSSTTGEAQIPVKKLPKVTPSPAEIFAIVRLKSAHSRCVYIDPTGDNLAKQRAGTCNPADSTLHFKYNGSNLRHVNTDLCLQVDEDDRSRVLGRECANAQGPSPKSTLQFVPGGNSAAPFVRLLQVFYPGSPGPGRSFCIKTSGTSKMEAYDCTGGGGTSSADNNFTLENVH